MLRTRERVLLAVCALFLLTGPAKAQSGACCAPAGDCTIASTDTCTTGTFQGDGTSCAPNPCAPTVGACCSASGWCGVRAPTSCASSFLGLGTTCPGVNCAQPTGACCATSAACTQKTPDGCQWVGGNFLGLGLACGTAAACPVGACCVPDGACSAGLTQPDCTLWNGTFQGIGSTCATITCPQPLGACCTTTSCGLAPGQFCALFGGIWQGPLTVCGPNFTCPIRGVCCRGACCSTTVIQSDCLPLGAAGAAFIPTSTPVCNPAGNNTAPCCLADFNKSGGINTQDVFDYLNEWFASNPYCRTSSTSGPLTLQDAFTFLNIWFVGGC